MCESILCTFSVTEFSNNCSCRDQAELTWHGLNLPSTKLVFLLRE